jgi:hypothetical protein
MIAQEHHYTSMGYGGRERVGSAPSNSGGARPFAPGPIFERGVVIFQPMERKAVKTPKNQPPRTLRGRRERALWRRLAPLCRARETLNPGSEHLLQALVVLLVRISVDPDSVREGEIKQARALSRSFGILR